MAYKSLAEFLAARYGVLTEAKDNPVTNVAGTTVATFLRQNPKRLAFVVVNLGGLPVYVGFTGDLSATKGIYLAPNGGNLFSNFREDFHLVGYEWYCYAAAANTPIYVQEVQLVTGEPGS